MGTHLDFDPDVLEANDEMWCLRRRAERGGRSIDEQRVVEDATAVAREQVWREEYLAARAEAVRRNPGSGWGPSPDPMDEDRLS